MKKTYFWNTLSGLIMAFQSVVMLMILMRVCDVYVAGVFTIAYANANLFLNIGKYGVRNYQASDVRTAYSFRDYAAARAASSIAMLVCGTAYLAWSAVTLGYDMNKTLVIFFMCAFKLVDAIEDVYHGDYQRQGRLDIAGKVLSLRLATTLAVFGGFVIATGDLLVSLVISTVYTAIFFLLSVWYVRRRYGMPSPHRVEGKKRNASERESSRSTIVAAKQLLKDCFPLFLAAFLLFYIGNAPKYAIDACLGDAEQAYYGFISMPVFFVGLLASFVYAPIITPLSRMWSEGDIKGFTKVFAKQILIVLAITAICDVATLIAGVPVLSIMYNVDLSPYLVELIILVSGGGFLALATLFTLGITIVRRQEKLIWGYLGVSLSALCASPLIVQNYGITGASWEYLALMAVLSTWFGVLFAFVVIQNRKRQV